MEDLESLKSEFQQAKKYLKKFYWVKEYRDYVKVMRELIKEKESVKI
jgi:hypothetical protein